MPLGEILTSAVAVVSIVSVAVAAGIAWGRASHALSTVTSMKGELAGDMKELAGNVGDIKISMARVDERLAHVEDAITPRTRPRIPTERP